MLDDSDDDDRPDGGYSCSQEGRQVEQQWKCTAQVEHRDESARCGRRPAAVKCRDQYGCGEQRAAWRCAVVCRLGHVAHGKRLGLVKLEYGSVAIFLSDVFPEERRKVGCADDGGTGSFVGHELCGGRSWTRNGRRRDLFKVIQRCFREFWKKQGLRVRVLVIARSDSEHPIVTGDRGITTWDSRRVRRKEEAKEGTRESSSVTSAASLIWV